MEVLGNTERRLGVLNIIVFILSFYVMGVLIFDTFYEFPKETAILLSYIDTAICIFFFLEFSVRFFQAENKLSFMKWGWIDLISCIPMVDFLRMGRILSIIRLIRVVRAFRTTTHLVNHLFANKAQGTFTSISVIAILLVIFSAIGILQVENDPNSNIKTAEDAIWWAYVTITTVGYGDKFPVTSEGRIIASVLMTAGVGLFGTFTAFVASWFVDVKSEKET
jgi:voltage-gated potassium channel